MRRREFITLLGGAAAGWPLAARAQPMPKMLRVGSVGVSNPRSGGLWAPIEQGLRELGYVEGQNLAIEYINLNGRIDGIGDAMQELVRRKVDVIVSLGNEIALKSALAATRTLPIVMVALDFDPFALGYVTSLARPTGNVTGLFLQQIELSAKRVQLARDAFPGSVNSAAFSPDGKRIVTGSGDITAIVPFPPYPRMVTASDKTARLWKIFANTQELVSQAKAAVPRCLTSELRKAFFLPPEP